MTENEKVLKIILTKVKEESEKAGLKLNIEKIYIIASGPITSWQIYGETMKQWHILFSWAPKITADGDYSHGIKRHLLLWRTAMSSLDSILKRRHYFTDKDPYSLNYGFSNSHVRTWELDRKKGWVSKNWCFCTVVFEKTLKVPWTAKGSSQSILKKIYHEYSLEGLMLKLKLQFFSHLMQDPTLWKSPWCWQILKTGGEGENRCWDGWMESLVPWTWVE